MGGGAGKAIAGLLCNTEGDFEHSIILLESPKEQRYVQICRDAGIAVIFYDENNDSTVFEILSNADIVVINWWNHPAMSFFMNRVLAKIQNRWIFWFHINGCSYPYIPYQLLEEAQGILFTTNYSLENPLWSRTEKENISAKAGLVLGMGDFLPEKIAPKDNYSSEEIKVGYVGTVSYAKMHCDYLTYIERIQKEIPNVRFLFVGECDNSIETEIKQRNLQNIVECVGKVEDVYPFYRDMDVLLYLLNADNYGTTENVLLEAMAVGLPIIVYDNPIERNIIEDKVCGYVAHSEDEVIQIVKCMSSHEAVRESIGRSAREAVLHRYSLQENLQRYTKTLIDVLHKDKTIFPFPRAIGATSFEWFLSFTGKERDKFLFLAEEGNDCEKEEEMIKGLPKIYVGKNKSSVFHFQNYYTEDESLNRICQKIRIYLQEEEQ